MHIFRQKITNAKRPEALGVSLININKNNSKKNDVQSNRLLVPNQPNPGLLLSIPRTPGDVPQVFIFFLCIRYLYEIG